MFHEAMFYTSIDNTSNRLRWDACEPMGYEAQSGAAQNALVERSDVGSLLHEYKVEPKRKSWSLRGVWLNCQVDISA